MSNAKPTPAPWLVVPTGIRMQGYVQPLGIVQVATANLVAGVFGDVQGGIDVAEANARLIAAAPELLDALQKLWGVVEDLSKSNPGFLGKLVLNDYEAYNQAMLLAPAAIAKTGGAK